SNGVRYIPVFQQVQVIKFGIYFFRRHFTFEIPVGHPADSTAGAVFKYNYRARTALLLYYFQLRDIRKRFPLPCFLLLMITGLRTRSLLTKNRIKKSHNFISDKICIRKYKGK